MKLDINKVLINGIRASSLLFLSAGNALAEATNGTASANEVLNGLGAFGTLAGTILTYSKWGTIFIVMVCLLALYASGQYAKVAHKVDEALKAREGLKNMLIDSVLVVFGFILLFSVVVPLINTYIP